MGFDQDSEVGVAGQECRAAWRGSPWSRGQAGVSSHLPLWTWLSWSRAQPHSGGLRMGPDQSTMGFRPKGVPSASWSQVREGKIGTLQGGPAGTSCAHRATGWGVSMRERVALRGCFPSQWGSFWLCFCSHCGNCTCPVQCRNMTSFSRVMYTDQPARKLPPPLLAGCECVSARLSPPPSPSL